MTCLYPYKCPNRVEATTWNEVSHGKQSWVCGCTGPLEAISPLCEPVYCPDGVHSMFDPCPGDCQCVCPDPPRAIDFECPLPHNPFAPKPGMIEHGGPECSSANPQPTHWVGPFETLMNWVMKLIPPYRR